MTTDNKTTVTQSDTTTVDNTRRSLIQAGASSAALGVLGFPAIVRAQSSSKIRIGYWPIAAGLPFYAAVEKGFFKEAGLDVDKVSVSLCAFHAIYLDLYGIACLDSVAVELAHGLPVLEL
jgi:hypothetical protein